MKRLIGAVLTAFFIICVTILSSCSNNASEFKSISLSDIDNALSEGKTLFVLYGVEDCSACEDAKAKLNDIVNKYPEIEICYLDGDSSDGKTLSNEYDIPYAPYLICIKNGDCFLSEDFTENRLNTLVNLTKESTIDRFIGFQNIEYVELYDIFQQNTDFLLYIGRDDCRDCQTFHPIVEKITEEKYGIYYFDIKEYRIRANDPNATQEDINTYEKIKNDFFINWVPSVYRIINGVIVDKFEFLDNNYYLIEDESEQEQYIKNYIQQFEKWIEYNY